MPPHVASNPNTDACAMCHRAHTSAAGVLFEDALGTKMSALLIGDGDASTGDTELCFSCHGYGSLGAEVDVQADLEKLSRHRSAPATSSYGPEYKDCSECHDSHGSSKTASGTPFPSLLRRFVGGGDQLNKGDAYCADCHDGRAGDLWNDLAVWRQTAHADITPTASGTEIVCSACHAPHGSDNTALIVERLVSPSAPTTVAVPANDRWLCYGCHPGSSATYPGGLAYEESVHGSSDESISVVAEWAERLPAGSASRKRRVGECQACHASMGVDDGSGAPIAKLVKAEGKQLCYTCHRSGSTVATDMASIDLTPQAGVSDLVLGLGATNSTGQFGRVQVYSRQATDQATLDQPREFLGGRRGPVATGDFDGDGKQELLAASGSSSTLTAMGASDLSGMDYDPGEITLLATATHLLVADVMDDALNRPEVIAADGSVVRFYRWNGASLAPVGSVTTTGTVTGLAAGNVLGTLRDEIAVTCSGPERLEIISATTGSLEIAGSYATRSGPRGPSIGDMDGDNYGEIAVANSGESTATASVFSAGGSEVVVTEEPASALSAVSTAIGNVFTGMSASGTSGAELVVVRDDPDIDVSGSWLDVYPQLDFGGLDAAESLLIGGWGNPTDVAIANTDGDAAPEVAIALAGTWSKASNPSNPGLFLVQTDATSLVSGQRFDASGTESAGSGASRAWIAVADFGGIGLSRHASSAVEGTHVSTETAGFERHVECADCHNAHETTSTVEPAPAVLGASKGAWGVAVENAPANTITYTGKAGVDYEYELCLKCHGQWSSSGRTRDIASEVDTRNASVHAVEATSSASEATDGSFVSATPAWANDSVLRCTDCHGNADVAEPAGPHSSASAPLLRQPYVGVSPSADDMLCYRCHRPEVYRDGTADGVAESTSRFYDADLAGSKLHNLHVAGSGVGCSACHGSHGTAREHLIRGDVGFTHDGTGGACANDCHTGGASHSYSRP